MSPWQAQNLVSIQHRLAPLQSEPPGVLFEHVSRYNHIIVRRTPDQVLLCYRHARRRLEEVESRLNPSDPLALPSPYTRAMLLSLLWQPQPHRILLIGLGGGRLQMVLHHCLEDAEIDTVELDPMVVEVAGRFFGIAPDARQRILVSDGRAYLQTQSEAAGYDVILLDAYRVSGIPFHLCTHEFYTECRALLRPAGVIATNLQAGTSLYDATRKTFAASFPHTAAFSVFGGNVVVVGTDTPPLSSREMRSRVNMVQRRLTGFSLSRLVQTVSKKAPYRQDAPILSDADAPLRPE